MSNARSITKGYLEKFYPNKSRIIILAENHTKNLFYIEHLHYLKSVFEIDSIKEIIVTNFDADINKILYSHTDIPIYYKPIDIIKDAGDSDLIILNNDLSFGYNNILDEIKCEIIPNPNLGWYNRSKHNHFNIYTRLVKDFCKEFGLDDFLFTTAFDTCYNVDFKEKQGLYCIAEKVQILLDQLKYKYKEYGIVQDPYIMAKPDKGTYGMGILRFENAEDVMNINKDDRKKAAIIKDGVSNSTVFLQEGISSSLYNKNGDISEVTVYMINSAYIGNFLRCNNKKGPEDNLNSNGMYFSKDILSEEIIFVSSLIARIASISTTYEEY